MSAKMFQGVCCEGYCCFEGFSCQNGGCGIDEAVNGTHSVWTPGIPFVSGTTLPP